VAEELDPTKTWICATAGNFGQGLAYAARARGASVHVFAAPGAPAAKLERMRALGARVETCEDEESVAREYAEASEERIHVRDGVAPAIAEGAGTIGVELAAAAPIETAVIQVGDGALITGVARWLKDRDPRTRVVGVCARGAPAMARSFEAGRVVSDAGTGTIATALAVSEPVPESFARVRALVDEVVLVDDDELRFAMDFVAEALGLLVEPAGAAGVAALLRYRAELPGDRIAVLLTGAGTPSTSRDR
jgi:threonine dehydratase